MALWSGPALGGNATKKFLAPEQQDLQAATKLQHTPETDRNLMRSNA